MDRTLLDVSIFPYQKPQMNYLDSSKPYKVANWYLPLKNDCWALKVAYLWLYRIAQHDNDVNLYFVGCCVATSH